MSTLGWSRRGAGVLLAALICAVLAVSGFDSTVSAQGAGTDYDLDDDGLIEVTTEAQLSAIRWDLDGNGTVDHSANEASYSTAFPSAPQGLGCPAPRCTGYELAADISLTNNGGMGWEPIGNSTTNFTATFDGNAPDYIIDSLFINRTTTDYVGLFGVTGTASAIRNVTLTSVNVTGKDYVGGLTGRNQGPIDNCETTGAVTGRWRVGGLSGLSDRAITESESSATVTSVPGGIAGGLGGSQRGGLAVSAAIAAAAESRGLKLSSLAVSTTREVAENTAAGVDIGAPVVATDSSGTVTYTLGGTDAASFDIDAATGQLETRAALDYETRSSYEVTVTATDSDGTTDIAVTINVTNVIELTAITGPTSASFGESGWGRVATFTASSDQDRDGVNWTLSGDDAGHFSIDSPAGALRFHIDPVAPNLFPKLPDFESPDDDDTDNEYSISLLAQVGSNVSAPYAVTVTVTDVDEAGALSLSSTRPALGAVLTAVLTDPDGVTAGTAVWQWERSTGRNAWAVIDGAAAASYTPVAADTNTFLRVTATYADEHGTGKTVSEVAPNVVTGPLLTGLTAETDDSQADTARGLYPAFDPLTLHYGIGCNSTDTLVLTVSAAADTRVAVAGVQAASAPMAVDVSEDSDVAIRVTDSSGAGTTYVVHCLPEVFFEVETHTFPNTDAFEDLILFNLAGYLRLIDRNGVPRLHLGFAGVNTFAVRFHRVGAGGAYRYGFRAESPGYIILDEDFEVLADDVRTVAPLTSVDSHDFQILEDGNYLLMSYEPATRDFSDIDLPYLDGAHVSSVDVEDAAFQIVTPGRHAVFTWNSWGNMAIEDCVQHRFPVTLSTDPDMRSPHADYAHINGMHVVDGVLVASIRGCSKVLGIDVEPGATRGDVLWRMGRTNLSDEEWAARDIGPRPLDFINDPAGEFCGQHSARILPNGNVFLFDNGSVCVIDPWTFEQLGREGSDFSRAVEYALDLENHEAVFVRDHSLRGTRDHLGYANGTVFALDNGDWLVSWGRPLDANVTIPDNERATLVDPATGQEKLGLRFRELPSSERWRRINATVAPAEALAPRPEPLTAEFPASAHTSLFHTGSGDAPQVIVAFNQPVVDFSAASPSISVQGGTVESVSAHVVAGERANTYVITLVPDGDRTITVRLLPNQACSLNGICIANGTMLSEVPDALVIEPPVITLASAAGGAVTVSGSAVSVEENHTGDLVNVTATDPESTHTDYTLALGGTHSTSFTLSSTGGAGVLSFTNPPDHEVREVYRLTLTASNASESSTRRRSMVYTRHCWQFATLLSTLMSER